MEIDQILIEKAKEAMKYAYAPYSHFFVGAALLAEDGTIYTGCNIENAAYGPTNCGERTAFFKAISEGKRKFKAICIVAGKEGQCKEYTPPCGVCRQVMMEFCNPQTFRIILAAEGKETKTYLLKELFPMGFGSENLEDKG